ncbi:MAG: YhgE/Pip family protein [Actinomycetaceae bacterium]|nr:YhgE/Pip family protein [Actinomycetaceae bacterium]MDY6083325.1 YhgE/Pip family protein [Actinomycetaceae bacterium]
MRSSWRVFTRDIKRIVAVPQSLVVLIGILITPALYSWLNIAAFWNPYTATGHLPIGVVNSDKGAYSELTGSINMGDMIVDRLKADHQLGWRILDHKAAQQSLERGTTYATFVIPPTFSTDISTIFSGSRTQPFIDYYVNEKKGAIAPKITDAGANMLDVEVTSTFRAKVGEAVAEALRSHGIDLNQSVTAAHTNAAGALNDIEHNLSDATQALAAVEDTRSHLSTALSNARNAVSAADPLLTDASSALGDAQSLLSTMVNSAQSVTTTLGKASTSAQNALEKSSLAAGQAVEHLSSVLSDASSELTTHTDRADQALDAARRALDALGSEPLLQQATNEAQNTLTKVQQVLDHVKNAHADALRARESIQELSSSMTNALNTSRDSAERARSASASLMTTLSGNVTTLSSQLGSLSATIGSARESLTQVSTLINSLDHQVQSGLNAASSAMTTTDDLAQMTQSAQADVAALVSAIHSGTLTTLTGLDPANIGRYVAAPVHFDQQALYHVTSYGAGMAAMFINLSLWIGAFILIIIFRVEVDKEGFDFLSLRAAYAGRYMLLAALSVGQGIIVSVGTLLIGIKPENPVALIVAAALIGPCYLAIIYGLSAALNHIGRVIAVVLAVLQIPGASGIYPIELMPSFFRKLYPLLPFSYGIDTMREAIGGFYGSRYFRFILIVVAMGAVALVLGYVGRHYFGYFNRLFYESLARTDLIANENVLLMGPVFRLSHIIALLSNRKEFSSWIESRRHRFDAHYSTIIRSLRVVGVAGVIALAVVSRTTRASKPALLAIASCWGLVIIGLLIAAEALKNSLNHAEHLSHLSEEDLIASLVRYRTLTTGRVPDQSSTDAAYQSSDPDRTEPDTSTTEPDPIPDDVPAAHTSDEELPHSETAASPSTPHNADSQDDAASQREDSAPEEVNE